MKPAAVILAVFAASVAAVPIGDKVEKRQAHIKTCTGQKFGDCPKKLPYIGKRYISERKSVPSEHIVSVDTGALMAARAL